MREDLVALPMRIPVEEHMPEINLLVPIHLRPFNARIVSHRLTSKF